MKNNILYLIMVLLFSMAFISCEKEQELLIPYPNDITFDDQDLGRFSFRIPDAPFQAGDAKSGIISVNVVRQSGGAFTGFALSNKSYRSYPWFLSPDWAPANLTPAQAKASLDSCIFSVATLRGNLSGNYLVGHAKNNDAFITLQQAAVVEHALVANTTYAWLLATYGSIFSGTLVAATQHYSITGTKVRNPNNPNTAAARFGRWYLPGPNGVDLVRLAGYEILQRRETGNNTLAKGYIKLVANGYRGTTQTGQVEFYLACRPNVNPEVPEMNFIANDWYRMDLFALGEVDKIVFNITSDYVDASGNMMSPPYFALDGIRIRK
jgi:hypothetical protein